MSALTEEEVIAAIQQGKLVSFGAKHGCDRDYVVVNWNGLVWKKEGVHVSTADMLYLIIE